MEMSKKKKFKNLHVDCTDLQVPQIQDIARPLFTTNVGRLYPRPVDDRFIHYTFDLRLKLSVSGL